MSDRVLQVEQVSLQTNRDQAGHTHTKYLALFLFLAMSFTHQGTAFKVFGKKKKKKKNVALP